MRSNYKPLGDYIRPCEEFNDGMKVTELLGINNIKYFQDSHTNTIGIDLQGYRIVRKGQFAYNRATTRNGDKISIALRQGDDCIVSPSYRVFESKDENVLNSEYLMMWFRRPEFDRYARFKSHGSAHEYFELEQMYEVQLPVPHIDKQREIVAEYNTILQRIDLNDRLIQKLEEAAQAIYKQWFVDFEFPNENGKPYKSAGGAMVESDLGDIPAEWKTGKLSDVTKIIMGQSPKGETYNTDGEGTPLVNGPVEFGEYFPVKTKFTSSPTKLSADGDLIICVRGSTTGRYVKSDGVYCLGRGVCGFRAKKTQRFVDQLYKNNLDKLLMLTTGSTFPNWDRESLSDFPVIIPKESLAKDFEKNTNKIFLHIEIISKEMVLLQNTKDLLLSKLATVTG